MRFAVLMLCVAMLVVPQAYAADEALISQQHCQQLTAHTPQDNVRYRGGVDVNGKAIAPADLADEDEASSNWADDLAKQATVAVTVDLASYLGLAMPTARP